MECKAYEFECFQDSRGVLLPIEFKHLPFKPKRAFFMTYIPPGSSRGNHAHRECEQYMQVLRGTVKIEVVKEKSHTQVLSGLGEGLHIPPFHWVRLTEFSHDCVLAVFASHEYDSDDFMKDWHEFQKTVHSVQQS